MSRDGSHCYETEVRATADCVWQALVNPDLTEKYYFNTRVESNWKPGSNISYRDPQGRSALEGKIMEIHPPGRLVTTFEPKWVPADQSGPPSVVIWEIVSEGNISRVRLTHEGLDPKNPITEDIQSAWQPTLDSLKNVVELAGG
jgi:uncharacterized protein YndB with AHSA1/START domain